MAGFDHVASEADALRYAADRLASNNWVSLGGWGGRIVAAFAEPVPNTGGYDLYVKGNQFDTSSEPGIVWVSQDANGDGAPNDTWYELRGSEYDNAETIRGYKITYTRPAEADAPVAWSDNTGGSGTIDRVKEHTQAYYPEWLGEQFTFEGTRLPDNIGKAGEKWTMEPFAWGYADNYSASDRTGMTNRLRISGRSGRWRPGQPRTGRLHHGADRGECQSAPDRRGIDRGERHRLLPHRHEKTITAHGDPPCPWRHSPESRKR